MPLLPDSMNLDRAAALLGVVATASEAELRSAYLQKVQQHPPDRDPEVFEQIRDAYEHLRNPAVRARAVLVSGPPADAPLTSLLDGLEPKRAFVGSQLWIELWKEKRRDGSASQSLMLRPLSPRNREYQQPRRIFGRRCWRGLNSGSIRF